MEKPYSRVPSLQGVLSEAIKSLMTVLGSNASKLGLSRILLIGSCAYGKATYRSDIDLLLVLENEKLSFATTRQKRDAIDALIARSGLKLPLELDIHCILPASLQTKEAGMRQALETSVVLFDSEEETNEQS